jgi:hypothetical protein
MNDKYIKIKRYDLYKETVTYTDGNFQKYQQNCQNNASMFLEPPCENLENGTCRVQVQALKALLR